MHISKGSYPVTLLPPPRRLVPSLGLGTTWVRRPQSGSCHYPTAATKCNACPRQAAENPVGGKACSSTKGGLLRYIANTYSIHKVSSLKFAYFQGRLSRHITSPEKTRPESLPGDYMGKLGNSVLAVVIIPPLPPNVTNSRAKPQQTPSVEKHAHPPRVVYCVIYPTLTRFTKSRV